MKIIADLLVVLSPVPIALYAYFSGAQFRGLSGVPLSIIVYLVGLVIAWASMMFVMSAYKASKENHNE
jgi:hypothetical protein